MLLTMVVIQVNLEWLDLSFNNISKLEGLDKLVKLTDLSLFSNKLEKVENIQTLTELVVLSLGKTCLLSHSLCLDNHSCRSLTTLERNMINACIVLLVLAFHRMMA